MIRGHSVERGEVEISGSASSQSCPDPVMQDHPSDMHIQAAQGSGGVTRVLLIDDSDDDYVLTRQMLAQADGDEFVLDWVSDYDGAEAALEEGRHDVYLVDYQLGERTGLDLLTKLHELGSVPPIIMLTGHDGLEFATRSIQLGATDFLVKGQIVAPLLIRSLKYAVARHEFRKAEAHSQKLLQQKNKRLSELYSTAHQFVDNVSHEFRTPLTVIREFASILADGLAGELNSEQREYIGIILGRVDDLVLMVNDMLDISRLEAGLLGARRRENQTQEIIERVQSTLERKAVASGVALRFELSDALPTVYCDADNIARVIINLVVNACKYCGDEGEVTLWARHDIDRSHVTFGVSDNGPGIGPEHLQVIFERFEQIGGEIRAANKGVGLGLNIAKELVQINFGDIAVDSNLGEGSTFTFTVPTFEPVEILDRFTKRIEYFRNGSSHASLITMSVASDVGLDVCNKLELFLEKHTRRSDLIFRKSKCCWLVCAATNQPQLDEMLIRINEAHRQTRQNLPGDQLPALETRIDGTWSLADDRDGFVAAFRKEWETADAKPGVLSDEREDSGVDVAEEELRSA